MCVCADLKLTPGNFLGDVVRRSPTVAIALLFPPYITRQTTYPKKEKEWCVGEREKSKKNLLASFCVCSLAAGI